MFNILELVSDDLEILCFPVDQTHLQNNKHGLDTI